MSILKRTKFLGIITALFFVVDRITKCWALTLTSLEHLSIGPIPGFSWLPKIDFRLVFNRGISWGILNNETGYAFIFVSFFICAVTFWLLRYILFKYRNGLSIFPESLVFLGSLSNIFDRFAYGGVIDFILLDFGSWIFPIFNLADCAIVFGVFLMFMSMLTANENA